MKKKQEMNLKDVIDVKLAEEIKMKKFNLFYIWAGEMRPVVGTVKNFIDNSSKNRADYLSDISPNIAVSMSPKMVCILNG